MDHSLSFAWDALILFSVVLHFTRENCFHKPGLLWTNPSYIFNSASLRNVFWKKGLDWCLGLTLLYFKLVQLGPRFLTDVQILELLKIGKYRTAILTTICVVFQSLRSELELEREQCTAAKSSLERERVTSGSLRRELDLEREQHRQTKNKYKTKVTELKTNLEVEKSKCDEVNRYKCSHAK